MNASKLIAVLSALALSSSVARADVEAEPPAAPPAPAAGTPGPPPALPYLMRPIAPVDVLRSDTVVSSSDSGTSMVTALLGGHRLTPTFGLILRLTYTFNWPDVGPSGTAFANP